MTPRQKEGATNHLAKAKEALGSSPAATVERYTRARRNASGEKVVGRIREDFWITCTFELIERECRECGRSFEFSSKGGIQAVYCSAACRQRAYRERRKAQRGEQS